MTQAAVTPDLGAQAAAVGRYLRGPYVIGSGVFRGALGDAPPFGLNTKFF